MKLVVNFSYTGHTRALLAEEIKEKLNCDILELKRVEPYSSDYNVVVNDEQNSENSNIIPEIAYLWTVFCKLKIRGIIPPT